MGEDTPIDQEAATPSPVAPRLVDLADDDLLRAARAGDDRAFATLIQRHDGLLTTLAHRLVSATRADEIQRAVYVKAYRALPRRPGRAARPWLIRLTYLAAVDRQRRRERRRAGGPGRKPVVDDDTGDLGHPGAASALAALPLDQRAVVVLVDELGVEVDEVAAALGTDERVAGTLLDEARRALSPADLSELPPAAHGPEFWEQLGRRLLAEREAPPAPTPSLPDASDASAAARATRPPPVAMQKRPPRRRGRFGRREPPPPDPVEGLASEARRQRVRSSTLALVGKAAAVVVVVGLLGTGVVAAIRLGSRARSPLRTESVADISRRSTAALAEAETFAADVTRTEVGPDGSRRSTTYRLARDDQGSYLLARLDPSQVEAFDAATATLSTRAITVDATGTGSVEASRLTGLASGPPDPDGRDEALPDQDLALAARALLAVDDQAPQQRRVAGRAVWVLEGPLPGVPSAGRPDAVELVVDRARLAPVQLTFTRAGRMLRELRFTDTVIDGPVGPFTVDLEGETVQSRDHGFDVVDLPSLEAVVGYQPPRPTYLPEGFELVMVTADGDDGVASMRYQRGFEAVTVTIRTAPVPAGTPWPDPFEREGAAPTPTPVTLTGGAFRVVEAQRVARPGALPSLWGSDGELAFTVSGDLSAEQLVRVAESLG